MSQQVFSVCPNPREVDSNTRERMNSPARGKASGQRANASFFHVLSRGCPQKVRPRLKVSWKMGFPTSNDSEKSSQLYSAPWGFSSFQMQSKLATKTSHHNSSELTAKTVSKLPFRRLSQVAFVFQSSRTEPPHPRDYAVSSGS